jgi:hypothetical protein
MKANLQLESCDDIFDEVDAQVQQNWKWGEIGVVWNKRINARINTYTHNIEVGVVSHYSNER